jgi:uncharacterized protein
MGSSSQSTVHLPDRNCTLVIMAKAPKPGMVKTRLTHDLPLPAVTTLYRCLLADTVALARSLSGVEVAVMCPGSDVDELARLLGDAVQIVAQKGEGLAAGLASVFAHFATGQRRVIAFNSDSPHLPAQVLESAFEALTAYDIVVGPTHDGGYYLIGAKTAYTTLFENDGMGTTNALEALLARARALELSVGFTDLFYDIDVAGDLIQLAAELRAAPARAPRTAAWFAEWGQAVAQLRPRIGEQ